jgi:hypothetical protein
MGQSLIVELGFSVASAEFSLPASDEVHQAGELGRVRLGGGLKLVTEEPVLVRKLER